ncbi:hypothetical protein LV89_01981 [Arcicella aurantiaca]|uniref:Uncharacterized protein n=1 Tax=Arcicella aurantiaca TaxID=591202 RepID=A0A316EVE8_9BACT|nr:hypothetical protein LV89_01981 [Arcicella aurantiaca]
MGWIFVLGSMLDVLATVQIMDHSPYLAIFIMSLRAGIAKLEVMYTTGLYIQNPLNTPTTNE